LSSIGDVIHALPSFTALRAALPDAEIGWAVERAAAPLLRGIPGLDHVHELDIQRWRQARLRPATWRQVASSVRTLRRRRYDVALDLQGLWKSALVGRLAGAHLLGMATRDLREPSARMMYAGQASATDDGAHVTGRGLRLASALCPTAPGRLEWPQLASRADREAMAARLAAMSIEAPILLHTAANWDSKRLPDERWAAVGRDLHAATGRDVLWLWGPGEEARVTELAGRAGAGNQPCFPTELPDLAALIHHAAVLVGGDSAPLHLAVACGAAVVGLFGPTDPARLGPTRPVDRVVVRQLECSHCHRRRCPLGTNECLEVIGADEIVRAAIERLADREAGAR
jgi:heptosyltransferase-1